MRRTRRAAESAEDRVMSGQADPLVRGWLGRLGSAEAARRGLSMDLLPFSTRANFLSANPAETGLLGNALALAVTRPAAPIPLFGNSPAEREAKNIRAIQERAHADRRRIGMASAIQADVIAARGRTFDDRMRVAALAVPTITAQLVLARAHPNSRLYEVNDNGERASEVNPAAAFRGPGGVAWFRGQRSRLGGPRSRVVHMPMISGLPGTPAGMAAIAASALRLVKPQERAGDNVRIRVRFVPRNNDPRGVQFRSITVNHAASAGAVMDKILGLSAETAVRHGSDIDLEEMNIDDQWFSLEWLAPRLGAGGPGQLCSRQQSKYYAGYNAQNPRSNISDCLVACVRAVAVSEHARGAIAWRPALAASNAELMTAHAGPDSLRKGLRPEDAAWLCAEFGVSLTVINADATQRTVTYRDSPRKKAAAVAVSPVVLASYFSRQERENGDSPVLPQPATVHIAGADRELIGIAYTAGEAGAPGHYFIATERRGPASHPVTGEELEEGTPPPSPEAVQATLIAQGRAKPRKAPAPKVEYKEMLLIYDFETVWDAATGEIVPYAVSVFICDPEEPDIKKQVAKGAERKAKGGRPSVYYCAADAAHPPSISYFGGVVVSILDEAPSDVRYHVCAYNGSRFDAMILAQAAAERELLASTSFLWHNSALLQAKICWRHPVHDLCRFLACPLKDACESFKTAYAKVDGFNHAEPQGAYLSGQLAEWIGAHSEKLREYCVGDTLALADLYIKARASYKALLNRDILDFPTIGSMAYSRLKETAGPDGALLGAATREEDRWIRRAMNGGRVQVLGNGGKPFEVVGDLAMLDVKSEYPFVAINRDYPCGERQWVDGAAYEAEKAAGHLGIWEATVHEQPGPLPAVLPRRVAGASLDWAYRGEMEVVATSVDLDNIAASGGRFTPRRGLVWASKTREIFARYFAPVTAEKNAQDDLKAAKSPAYNPAKREAAKLAANCVTGKVGQRNDGMAEAVVVRARDLDAALAKLVDGYEIRPLGGDLSLVIGERAEPKRWSAAYAHPAHLSCFIYSYAREIFYRLAAGGSLYGDTDSGAFRKPDADAIKLAYPEMFPGVGPDGKKTRAVLGQLEEELYCARPPGTARQHGFFIMPKVYAIFNEDDKGHLLPGPAGLAKLKAKGLGKHDAVVTEEEYAALMDSTLAQRWEFAEGCPRKFGDPTEARKMFERLLRGEPVFAVCSQIRRVLLANAADPAAAPVFQLRQALIPKIFTTTPEAREAVLARLARRRGRPDEPAPDDVTPLAGLGDCPAGHDCPAGRDEADEQDAE